MKHLFFSTLALIFWSAGCNKKQDVIAVDLGDGLLQSNEVCDDGVNDGSYGGCAKDGKGLAPRCGDNKAETVTVWEEHFDTYAAGTALTKDLGWDVFDDPENPVYATVSNTQAASAPSSLAIAEGMHPVKTFRFITQGLWRLSYKVFIPGTGQTNNNAHTLILLNDYPPYKDGNYSLELKYTFTGTKTVLTCGSSTTGIDGVKDAWAQVTIDIDFDQDKATVKYNDKLVCQPTWTAARPSSTEAEKRLAALYLAEYTTPAPQKAFYDDFILQRIEECDTGKASQTCTWSCRNKQP